MLAKKSGDDFRVCTETDQGKGPARPDTNSDRVHAEASEALTEQAKDIGETATKAIKKIWLCLDRHCLAASE